MAPYAVQINSCIEVFLDGRHVLIPLEQLVLFVINQRLSQLPLDRFPFTPRKKLFVQSMMNRCAINALRELVVSVRYCVTVELGS